MPNKPTYQELEQRIADLEAELSQCSQNQIADAAGHFPGLADSMGPFLSSIINNTQNVIYVKDTKGRFLLVNTSFCDIFDLQMENVIGKKPHDLFPLDIANQHLENDRQIIAAKTSLTFSEQADLADGRHDYISVKFPIVDDAGAIVAVGGISTDITEHVRTEKLLRSSEERFRLTFHTSPDAININRLSDGRFIDINQGYTNFTGYTREDIIGKSSLDLNLWKNPEDRKRLTRELMRNGFVNNFEAPFTKKNGAVGVGSISAGTMRLDNEDVIISITRDITDIKQAQEALQQSEEMNRLLLEQADAVVWTVDKSLRVTSFRGAGLAKLGLEQGQLVGQRLQDFLTTEDENAPAILAVRQALRGKSVSFHQVQGGILWVSRVEPLRDHEHNIIGSVAVSIDITERTRSEALLQASELRFKNIVDASPMGIHLYELLQDGRLVFIGANKASDHLLGVSHQQFIGKTIEEAFPPLKETEVPDRYREAAENGNIWRTEQIRYEEGLISGAFEVVAFQTEPGKMAAFLNEITARKKAELALKESQQRLAAFLENSPDAFFVHDVKGTILQVNAAACKALGYSQNELIGMAIRDIDVMLSAETTFQHQYANGSMACLEGRHRRKDGSTFPVEVSLASIDLNGEILHFGFAKDLTERKQMEQEKELYQSRLIQAQKLEAIGTLAGGVAHDFNNLLMGIKGRASIMSIDLETAHPCREHVQAILEYTKSAADLTKQLLGFARGGKYEVSPFDINDVVQASAAMFGRTKKEIHIHQKFCSPAPVVMADQNQIEQVLLNLFVNAWQAMPAGGDIYLETSVVNLDAAYCKPFKVEPGGYVKISVTDTGIGMDQETRQRIFDPFFTTKGTGRGTGLGLASVYGILKNHAGFVTVRSEVGKGATFNVHLPVSQEDPKRVNAQEDKFVMGSETILLVDDEKMIVDVGKAMLEKLNYHVLCALGGKQAVDMVCDQTQNFNLVILDMIMPDLSGAKVFDVIKKTRPSIPVILSSGYSMNGEADKIIRKGCAGFIQKPFDLSELSHKVHGVLDKAK